jgi:hypothetical protein
MKQGGSGVGALTGLLSDFLAWDLLNNFHGRRKAFLERRKVPCGH